MKKMTKKLLVPLLFMLVLSSTLASNTLWVKKSIEPGDLNTGVKAMITLDFNNPFESKLPVKIVDKSIFGGNGLDIQCAERSIPPGASQVKFGPITPFTPGEYELGAAKITYTNPETGKEETITSNSLKVTVNGPIKQEQEQGITTLYQCNGMNMRSTSYTSSGTSINIQTGINMPSIQQGESHEMNQNTEAIKKEMEKEMSKKQQTQKAFKKNLEENGTFEKAEKALIDSGYTKRNESVNATSPTSGSFNYTYENTQGKKATISGKMENNQVTEIKTQKQENNPNTSKDNNKALQEKNQPTPAHKPIPWLLLALLALIALAAFLAHRIYPSNTNEERGKPLEKPDFKKEAMEMLLSAERLYLDGREKDACEKASHAIKHYFSRKYNQNKELNNRELLELLKENNSKKTPKVKECLALCSSVEFAKASAKEKEFKNMIEKAREAIG